MSSPTPVQPPVFVYTYWRNEHEAYIQELQSIFRTVLTNPHVVKGYLPIYVGYYRGPTDYTKADEVGFQKTWNEFVADPPPVRIAMLDDEIAGFTNPSDQRPECTVYLNRKLIDGWIAGLEHPPTLSKPHSSGTQEEIYLFLVVSTFLHEVGHAFSLYMRSFATPYKLSLKGYTTEVGVKTAEAQWSLIRHFENPPECEKEHYVKTTIDEQGKVAFEMGEALAGYIVEHEIFGGVIMGLNDKTDSASTATGCHPTKASSKQPTDSPVVDRSEKQDMKRVSSPPASTLGHAEPDTSSSSWSLNDVVGLQQVVTGDHETRTGSIKVLDAAYLERFRYLIDRGKSLLYQPDNSGSSLSIIDTTRYVACKTTCDPPERRGILKTKASTEALLDISNYVAPYVKRRHPAPDDPIRALLRETSSQRGR